MRWPIIANFWPWWDRFDVAFLDAQFKCNSSAKHEVVAALVTTGMVSAWRSAARQLFKGAWRTLGQFLSRSVSIKASVGRYSSVRWKVESRQLFKDALGRTFTDGLASLTGVSMNVKMSDRAKKFPEWAVKEAIEKSKERQKSDGSPCFISCYHWACNQGVILANLETGRIEIRQPFDLRIVVLVEKGVGVGVSDWDDFDIPSTATAKYANRLIHRKLDLPFKPVR